MKQTFMRACLALATMSLPAAAAEIKGVQAVLLHCWGATSRNTLFNTVANANVSTFAISSAPFLPSSTCVPYQTDRLANIKRITTDLRGRGVQVHVILFAGGLHDSSPSSSLPGNFKKIWTELITDKNIVNDSGVVFIIGSSLEDYYNGGDPAETALQKMAAGIGSANKTSLRNLVSQGRLTFHRSPGKPNNGDASRSSVTVLGDVVVPVSHEKHGSSPDNSENADHSCRYCFWSNDGPFASHAATNYKDTCADKCGVSDPEITVKAFATTTFVGNYRLLWRAAYNLFQWSESQQNKTTVRTFAKPAAGAPVRTDKGHTGFDTREAEALEELLGN